MNSQALRAALLGGLVPVILFTVVEMAYGTLAGLVAGMVFGIGEILYEKKKYGSVKAITWISNLMILILGSVSLLSSDGIWFKLQPAILEFGMGAALLGSVLLGKPLLTLLAKSQGTLEKIPPHIQPRFEGALAGLTARTGVFLWIHAGLATWAAFYAPTWVWATLKGVGFTISFIVYLVAETLVLRYRIRHSWSAPSTSRPSAAR